MKLATRSILRGGARHPGGNRRRALVLATALAVSLGIHVALLAWMDSNWGLPEPRPLPRSDEVAVALIAGPVAARPAPAAPPARPAPRHASRPRPRVHASAPPPPLPPSPNAITLPAPAPAPKLIPLPPDAVADAEAAEFARAHAVNESAPDLSANDAGTNAPPARAAATQDGARASPPAAARDPGQNHGPVLPAPPAGHWRLRVYYGDYTSGHSVASLEYRIELDHGHYRLSTEGRAEGLVALLYSGVLSQASAGRVTSHGLVPERYSEQRGKSAERSATVDWATHEIAFSAGRSAAAIDGMQDRLSVLVQLGMMARAMPERFKPGQSVAIDEMTLRDVERARYKVLGDEVLPTKGRNLTTLHLERTAPRGPDDPVIEIWLGYDQEMLPVRIRFTDPDGRVLDQMLAE